MASVAKIVAPVLLTGKFVRTSGLRSRASVMSPRGEILGFLIDPLVYFLIPFVDTRGLAASLDGSSRAA